MDGGLLLFVLFGIVIVGLLILGWRQARKRKKDLTAWAARRDLTYFDRRDGAVDDRFGLFDCFGKGQRRYAFNIMEGRWGDRPIEAFDYHYETTSTDSKGRTRTTSHYFSAAILTSDLPLKELFIRPEGFFDKVTEFFGYDDIDFESAEFSRKFYVKAKDRQWAFDVIHQRAMEFLLAQPRFTIKFAPDCVIAYRHKRFRPNEFTAAADVIAGLLDGLPDYVVKQQRGAM